MCAKVMSIK